GAGPFRGPDDFINREVGADRVALLADLVGLIGLEPVLAVAVFVREHRNGLGAEFEGGTKRPDRDLPAVGDQDLAEHVPAPFRATRVIDNATWRFRFVGALSQLPGSALTGAAPVGT